MFVVDIGPLSRISLVQQHSVAGSSRQRLPNVHSLETTRNRLRRVVGVIGQARWTSTSRGVRSLVTVLSQPCMLTQIILSRANNDDLVTDTRDGWSMEISKPQLLSKLPRAGLGDQARSKFCQVQGISHGRTRKRNEVCAAVDGDSVNIYEVS